MRKRMRKRRSIRGDDEGRKGRDATNDEIKRDKRKGIY